jgi:hypothetical protein
VEKRPKAAPRVRLLKQVRPAPVPRAPVVPSLRRLPRHPQQVLAEVMALAAGVEADAAAAAALQQHLQGFSRRRSSGEVPFPRSARE